MLCNVFGAAGVGWIAGVRQIIHIWMWGLHLVGPLVAGLCGWRVACLWASVAAAGRGGKGLLDGGAPKGCVVIVIGRGC